MFRSSVDFLFFFLLRKEIKYTGLKLLQSLLKTLQHKSKERAISYIVNEDKKTHLQIVW